MDNQDTKLILQVLQAINEDWAFTDQNDADSHMVLVDMDREEREDLKPAKALIAFLETERLIEFDAARSSERGSEREFMEFFDKKIPVPFVSMYTVTEKGRQFIAKEGGR